MIPLLRYQNFMPPVTLNSNFTKRESKLSTHRIGTPVLLIGREPALIIAVSEPAGWESLRLGTTFQLLMRGRGGGVSKFHIPIHKVLEQPW